MTAPAQSLTEALTPLPSLGQVPDDFKSLFVNEQGTIAIYTRRVADKDYVYVNGKEVFWVDAGFALNPVFSSDPNRWAALRRFPGTLSDLFSVMLDGKETGPYENVHALVFSKDGKRFMYSAGDRNSENLFLDGALLPGWVAVPEYCFTNDGKHVAYSAIGSGGCIYVDGVKGKVFTVVSDPHYGVDGRLLYRAKRAGKEVVNVAGQEGSEYGAVREPFFSADGAHVCYEAQQQNDWYAVLDEVKQAAYQKVASPQLSVLRNHLCYLASKAGEWCVVIDGNERRKYLGLSQSNEPSIMGVRLSEDASKVIYAATHDGLWCASFNEVEGNLFDYVTETTLTTDGSRYAYAAQKDAMWRAVIDGMEGTPYDSVWALTWRHENGSPLLYTASKNDQRFAIVNNSHSEAYKWVQIVPKSSSATWYYALKNGTIYGVTVSGY
jgi:hypothetical protein